MKKVVSNQTLLSIEKLCINRTRNNQLDALSNTSQLQPNLVYYCYTRDEILTRFHFIYRKRPQYVDILLSKKTKVNDIIKANIKNMFPHLGVDQFNFKEWEGPSIDGEELLNKDIEAKFREGKMVLICTSDVDSIPSIDVPKFDTSIKYDYVKPSCTIPGACIQICYSLHLSGLPDKLVGELNLSIDQIKTIIQFFTITEDQRKINSELSSQRLSNESIKKVKELVNICCDSVQFGMIAETSYCYLNIKDSDFIEYLQLFQRNNRNIIIPSFVMSTTNTNIPKGINTIFEIVTKSGKRNGVINVSKLYQYIKEYEKEKTNYYDEFVVSAMSFYEIIHVEKRESDGLYYVKLEYKDAAPYSLNQILDIKNNYF